MKHAVLDLSPKAFYLLNMVYYKHIRGGDLKDSIARTIVGYGSGVYADCKWELKEKGYIHIVQTKGNNYLWFVGKETIEKTKRRWKSKSDADFKAEALAIYEDLPF